MKDITSLNLEHIHSRLLHMLVDGGLLARHITKHPLKNVYPVVVGGINVMRCARLHTKATMLLGSIYKHDIDIKYVISKRILNNDNATVRRTHNARMSFINGLLDDPVLQSSIHDVAKRVPGLDIKLVVEDKLDSPHEVVKRIMVVSVRVNYYVNGELALQKTLMDTGLYTTFSQKYFNSYHTFFLKEMVQPIPYITKKGIPYATCGWAYYDTIRMLVVSGDAYRSAIDNNDTDEQRQQLFMKYVKYLAKFVVLYTQMNQLKGGEHYKKLKELYDSAQGILAKYGMKAYDTDVLDIQDKRILRQIVNALQKNTNLLKMEKTIRNSIEK